MPYDVGFSQDEITLLGSGSGELARRAESASGCTRPSENELNKEPHRLRGCRDAAISGAAEGTAGRDFLPGLRELRGHVDFLLQKL